MTIKKKENNKKYLLELIEKAKNIENRARNYVDFISNSDYEEFFINSGKYYLTI